MKIISHKVNVLLPPDDEDDEVLSCPACEAPLEHALIVVNNKSLRVLTCVDPDCKNFIKVKDEYVQ